MLIQRINYEFNRKRRLKPDYGQERLSAQEHNNVKLCGEKYNNRGYNVNFSGNLQSESASAAKTFMEKVMSTKAFNWLTGFAGEHNVAAASLIALFLAGGLRPAITVSLPGDKDMEDKIYAAGHSMASGLIGFGFSTLITTPIDAGIKYIYNDAKKMKLEDYNNLSEEELAKHIRKNNLTPEKIAKKMANDKLSEEEIIKSLKDNKGNNLSAIKIAKYVKKNDGVILPVRKLNKWFTIVSDKVDEINKLEHELFLENNKKHPKGIKKFFNEFIEKVGFKHSKPAPSPRSIEILNNIRNLTNHIEGISTSAHNVTEWAIAIPRAMLTIALIPPILKYVFHVQKKSNAPKQNTPQVQEQASTSAADISTVKNSMKTLNKFAGGTK